MLRKSLETRVLSGFWRPASGSSLGRGFAPALTPTKQEPLQLKETTGGEFRVHRASIRLL